MKNLPWLDDGYTHQACIAAVPGQHDTLVFTYRPLISEQRSYIAAAIAQQTSVNAATEILAQAIVTQVTTWNRSTALLVDHVTKLTPSLFDKLYATIAGVRSSDPLPTTGCVPEAYREGADLKNWSRV